MLPQKAGMKEKWANTYEVMDQGLTQKTGCHSHIVFVLMVPLSVSQTHNNKFCKVTASLASQNPQGQDLTDWTLCFRILTASRVPLWQLLPLLPLAATQASSWGHRVQLKMSSLPRTSHCSKRMKEARSKHSTSGRQTLRGQIFLDSDSILKNLTQVWTPGN